MTDPILRFETLEDRFRPYFIRDHVEPFDRSHFVEKLRRFNYEKVESIVVCRSGANRDLPMQPARLCAE